VTASLLVDGTGAQATALRALGHGLQSVSTSEPHHAFGDLGSFDVVVGSPAIWVEDEDASREDEFLDAVEALEPSLFLLETVRGLGSPRHKEFLDDLLEEFESMGYMVDAKVITVGGQRRLVILGRPEGESICWERGQDWRSQPAIVLSNLIARNLGAS